MIKTVKLNILIPLQYEKSDYSKTTEPNLQLSKEQINSLKDSRLYDSSEWFHYCFRNKPLEANYQMINSPLLNDDNYCISRIEMDSVVRSLTGLHKNENTKYILKGKKDIEFRIGKLRILFTKSSFAFLHIEVYASELPEKDTLLFLNMFGQINNSQPRIEYRRKISKDEEETVKINFKDIILTLINLQSYVPLYLYRNRITPYFQICLVGTCEQDKKLMFFDSVQSLSKRVSMRKINTSHIYIGKEPYISRFTGDRTFCLYVITGEGEEKEDFISTKNKVVNVRYDIQKNEIKNRIFVGLNNQSISVREFIRLQGGDVQAEYRDTLSRKTYAEYEKLFWNFSETRNSGTYKYVPWNKVIKIFTEDSRQKNGALQIENKNVLLTANNKDMIYVCDICLSQEKYLNNLLDNFLIILSDYHLIGNFNVVLKDKNVNIQFITYHKEICEIVESYQKQDAECIIADLVMGKKNLNRNDFP